MANKDVLDQINALRIRRTLALVQDGAEGVLDLLADSLFAEADLLSMSQKKGWQSERKELIATVSILRTELAAVLKRQESIAAPARPPVEGPTPSWTNPTGLASLVQDAQNKGLGKLVAGDQFCAGRDTLHGEHTWTGPRDEVTGSDRWRCPGSDVPTSLAEDVSDFLAGVTDTLPTDLACAPSHPLTTTATTAVLERLGTHLFREAAVHAEIDREAPDVHADPITPAVALFREAGTPTVHSRPIPPAGVSLNRYSWAELAAPAAPANIPDHLSPSQLVTLDLCPAQARISRYDGAPGVPLWGAVGGTAFHRAVEHIERDGVLVDWANPAATTALWNATFQAVIAETLTESGVPMADWHASNRGRENYSWWLVEGGRMLHGYVAYRLTHDDGRTILTLPDHRPAIELELMLNLGNGIPPVKVVLDIVFLLPDGSLEIWDHKTRQDFMGPIVDTIQLGTQAHALNAFLMDTDLADGPAWGAITARYFDARKGTLTDAFDPLDRHPLEELEMRYADADDKRRNRSAIPARSNLCKACPVAYLCPVGSKL